MDLILYTLQLKIRQAFHPRQHVWGFVGLVVFMLLGIFYGFMMGYVSDNASMSPHLEKGKGILLIMMVALTLSRAWFPNYKPLTSWIQPFAPIPRVYSYLLNLLMDFISSYFFSMISFIIVLVSSSDNLEFGFGIQLLWAMIAAHLVRRIIQTLLENRFRITIVEGIILALIVLSYSLALYGGKGIAGSNFAYFLGFLNIAFVSVYVEAFLNVSKKEVGFAHRNIENPYIGSLLRNKQSRVALIVALLFKVFILGAASLRFRESGEILFGSMLLMWLFSSPLVLFTYIFNNTWGYFRTHWITLDRASSGGLRLLRYHLNLLLVPLLLDFAITLIYFLLHPPYLIDGLISYLIGAFVLAILGAYWSLRFPSIVVRAFSLKTNTHVLANLVSAIVPLSLYSLTLSNWFYLLIPIYLLIVAVVIRLITQSYSTYRETMYLKLFKE